MVSSTAPLRVGLVGVGTWTQRCHLPNLLERSDVVVSAVCARKAESRAQIAARCPRPPAEFSSLEGLLDAQAADMVIIATPDVTHAPFSIQAMKRGVHVFCENPIGCTLAEAREVRQAAVASGRVAAVHLELRYADAIMAARKAVNDGRIGDVRYVTMVVHRDWQRGDYVTSWRSDPSQTRGYIFETWVHYLDGVNWVVGREPDEVRAQAADPHGAKAGAVLLRYPGNIMATVDFCLFAWGSSEELSLDIVGTNGRLRAQCIEGQLTVWAAGETEPTVERVPRPADWTYCEFPGTREELADVIDCIRTGAQPLANIDAATSAVALAEAVCQATESGYAVPVSSAT